MPSRKPLRVAIWYIFLFPFYPWIVSWVSLSFISDTELLTMTGKDKVLSWTQRLKIAVDSARGLEFLHTYPSGCIIHRDIKACLSRFNFLKKLTIYK